MRTLAFIALAGAALGSPLVATAALAQAAPSEATALPRRQGLSMEMPASARTPRFRRPSPRPPGLRRTAPATATATRSRR